MSIKLECTRCRTTSTIQEWNKQNMGIIPEETQTHEQWLKWKENHSNIILECPEQSCGQNSCVIDIESY